MKLRVYYILIVCFLFFQPMSASAFSDVSEENWAYEDIQILSLKEVVNGYKDGSFKPTATLTRAEAALLLVQAKGWTRDSYELLGTQGVFKDVPVDHWASPSINLAWERGMISGYGDNTFRPAQTITRMEFASILSRALDFSEAKTLKKEFKDAGSIPSWAAHDISLASSYGLINGYPDGSFHGYRRVQRDEAVTMVASFLKQVGACYDFWGVYQEDIFEGVSISINKKNTDMKVTPQVGQRIEKAPFVKGDLVRGIISAQGVLSWLDGATTENTTDTNVLSSLSEQEDLQLVKKPPILQTQFGEDSYFRDQAHQSSEMIRDTMRMNHQIQGQGEIIAIIDSGIDPGLSILRKLPDHQEKLIGFYDLTDEGLINQQGVISKTSRFVDFGREKIDLSQVQTRSGELPYGYFSEASINMDINNNGSTEDEFLVLFSDPDEAGQYTQIYIDIEMNGRFDDSEPLSLYEESKKNYTLSTNRVEKPFRVVLAECSIDGTSAVLGFDANGHGTAMAAAATGFGDYVGTAPGAKLLAIKAFDADGSGEWETIERAIQLAVQKGATVVNLSLGYQDQGNNASNSITYLAKHYHERYGVVFVGAAGNTGPGTATLSTPGNGESVLGVTGYLPRDFASKILGYSLNEDVLWRYGSRGPRLDGYHGIDVSAPVMGILPMPGWYQHEYTLVEGTSVSSALTSGAIAAYLSEKSYITGREKERNMVNIVRQTATPHARWSFYETGYGQLNWAQWDNWRDDGKGVRLTAWNSRFSPGLGLYERDATIGELPIYISNTGNSPIKVYLRADADWVSPVSDQLLVNAQSKRSLPLRLSLPKTPGFHVTNLWASTDKSGLGAVVLPVSVVVPLDLEEEEGHRQIVYDQQVMPGQISRQFVDIVPNDNFLQGTVFARENNLTYWLYDAKGSLRRQGELTAGEMGNFFITKPQPGHWEIIIGGGLENAQLEKKLGLADIKLEVQGGGPGKSSNEIIFVGNITKSLDDMEIQWVSFSVRDAQLRPLHDVPIEIDGRLYLIQNGQVRIKADKRLLHAIRSKTISTRI